MLHTRPLNWTLNEAFKMSFKMILKSVVNWFELLVSFLACLSFQKVYSNQRQTQRDEDVTLLNVRSQSRALKDEQK